MADSLNDDSKDRSAALPSTSLAPRLRLHHLFALTAVMAVLVAIGGPQQDFSHPDFQPPQFFHTYQVGYNLLYQTVAAVAITALGYGIAGHRQGQPFFTQPGHWMLAEISLVMLLSLPIALVTRWVRITPQMSFGDSSMIVMMIVGIYSMLFLVMGRIAINVYLAVAKCAESRWRNVFIAKAVEPVTFGLGDIAIIVLALLASVADRREQIPRDASHRCGVYVQIAMSALTIVGAAVGILVMAVAFLWRRG